ncbi:aminotransferase class V-fold PLP-dependent enzyme [Flavobacteriaceae bacterium]|nr:aminotransferase class V-fold PLP-dependent enzyme [Flavobacteriaceae bacterium]MDC0506739.1 aminotransferase class V-fold PLP-dependent enzyme [Flavobacteriaceae bacterium]
MIPIFKPYMPKNMTSEIEGILYSGKLSFGEKGKEFEEKLASYIGNDKVLTISSYNQALLIVLSTLGLKPGDEIIASPVSCLASNQPFVVKGLKVVWADVNPLSGTLSVDDVRSRITSKTKAIFHNHYCGYLGEIEAMNTLGKEFGIPVIDDCIEAFGSELNGKKTGNLGTDITVFSFQTVRLPNTIEGGALVFNNQEIFEKAKMIRDYGIERNNFRDKLNEINPDCDIKLEGYGALMGEINSMIGLKQLRDLDSLIKKQRANAIIWEEKINKEKNIESLLPIENTIPNSWVYGVLAKNKIETIKNFRKKGFYATSVHINNNIYSIFDNKIELKGVKEFMNHFVALPCGWWLNLENK